MRSWFADMHFCYGNCGRAGCEQCVGDVQEYLHSRSSYEGPLGTQIPGKAFPWHLAYRSPASLADWVLS